MRTVVVPGGSAAKLAALRLYRSQTGLISDDPQGFALSRGDAVKFAAGLEPFVELSR